MKGNIHLMADKDSGGCGEETQPRSLAASHSQITRASDHGLCHVPLDTAAFSEYRGTEYEEPTRTVHRRAQQAAKL